MAAKKKPAAKPKAQNAPVQKKAKRKNTWEQYKVSGDKLERSNPTCPKCGDGTFLALHKDRKTCGKCGYVEFK